jgi:membrane-associated phospholipid phosphatase
VFNEREGIHFFGYPDGWIDSGKAAKTKEVEEKYPSIVVLRCDTTVVPSPKIGIRKDTSKKPLDKYGRAKVRILSFRMNSFGKHTISSVSCFVFAIATVHLVAQEGVTLPDDPGQAFLAKAPARDSLPNGHGKEFLVQSYAREAIPDSPDQSEKPIDTARSLKPTVDTTTGVPQREATWRSLPGDFLHDQKDLWTFPFQVMKGRHLLPVALVVGGTVGLIYADSHDMHYFVTHQKNWDDANDVFDPVISTSEVIALPVGLLTAGYIRHDNREVNTAILATEAYGDSVIINLAMKAVTRRQRPSDVAPNGNFEDTFFNGGKSPLKGSSFPSAHATAVWSVATVVAERYRHRGKPWIPVLSYTLATAISFSRITESAHFPSDVWLGASLGYSIAKFQTLKPR